MGEGCWSGGGSAGGHGCSSETSLLRCRLRPPFFYPGPPCSLVKLGRAKLKVLPGSGTLYLLV